MSNYDFENSGGGFALDDDEDLDTMLNRATSAAETDEDINGGVTMPEDPDFDLEDLEDLVDPEPAKPAKPEKAAKPAPRRPVEPEPEPVEEVSSDPEPLAFLEPEPELAPEPEPEPEPTPAPKPVKPNPAPSTQQNRGKIKVPTEKELVAEATRIINILDVYRSLSKEEKEVTVQFVTDGELSEASDPVVVVKVLTSNPTLGSTMRALREAWECEPVERAFYAMALSSEELHSLGNLVTVFTEEEYDPSLSNLAYSRKVVAGIAKLQEREIGFVKATESVLAKAGDTSHS